MPGLEEDVGLDISSALASVDELASTAQDTLTAALVGAAEAFSAAIGEAAQSIGGDTGFAAVSEQAAAASAGVEQLGTASTDTAAELSAVADQTANTSANVEQLGAASVDAAAGVSAVGGAAATAGDDLVSLKEDLGAASDEATNLGQNASDAASGVTELGQSASDSGQSASEGSKHFDVFGAAASGIGASMALAKGETEGVTEGLHALPSGLGEVAAGFAGVAVAAGGFFDAGLKVQTQQDRLNLVFGDFKETVEHINVGGLTGSLDALAAKAGSTGVGLGLTAANLGQFAQAGGQTQEASAKLAAEFEALDLKAAALNPSLGGADQAAQRLFTALLTGRDKALAPFALGIDAAAIKTEAYKLGLEKLGDALTPLDKLTAGLTLATEKAGDTLGTKFAQGADLAGTKARALRAEVEQSIEKLGQPVVAPLLELGTKLVPVAEELGKVAAIVVTALLPAIDDASSLIRPFNAVLTGVGDVLQTLQPLITPAVEGFVAFKVAAAAGEAIQALGVSLALLPGELTAAATVNALFAESELAVGAAAEVEAAEVAAATAAMDVNPIFAIASALAAAAVAFGVFGNAEKSVADQTGKLVAELEKANAKQLIAQFEGVATLRAFDDGVGLATARLHEFRSIANENVGVAQRLLDALKANGENTKGYQEVLDKAVSSQKAHSAAQKETKAAADQLLGSTQSGTQALEEQKAALDAQKKAADDAAQALKSMADTAAGQLPSVTGVFDEAATAADKFGQSLNPEELLSSFEHELAATVSFGQNLAALANAGFLSLADLIAQKGPQAGGQIAQQLADGIRNGQPEIAQQLDQTSENLRLAGQTYHDIIQNEVGPKIQFAEAAAFSQFAPTVKQYLGFAGDEVSQGGDLLTALSGIAGQAAAGALYGGLSSIPADTEKVMGQTTGAVADAATDATAAGTRTGQAAEGGFGVGISGLPDHASGAVHLAGDQLTAAGTTVAEDQARAAGLGIGGAMGAGIYDGLANVDTAIADLAAQIIEEAEAAARRAARSHSPSLLFAELGEDLAAGLALGITNGAAAVAAASADLIGTPSAPSTSASAGVVAPSAPSASPSVGAGVVTTPTVAAASPEPVSVPSVVAAQPRVYAPQQFLASAGGPTYIDQSVHTQVDARGLPNPDAIAAATLRKQRANQFLVGR